VHRKRACIAFTENATKGPEYHQNGVFLWVIDPNGNKVELWEPKNWDDKHKK
jgi:hypothetical protein